MFLNDVLPRLNLTVKIKKKSRNSDCFHFEGEFFPNADNYFPFSGFKISLKKFSKYQKNPISKFLSKKKKNPNMSILLTFDIKEKQL